jgi:DNA internalization-related competence protein ComEC/Rec2
MRRHVHLIFLLFILLFGCLDIDDRPPVDRPTGPPASGSEMSVVVLDIGQGDAIFVLSPSGKAMLVDGGNSSRDGREVILPYLQSRGVDKLDVMVLTHPDADHVGGLPTVLKSMPVDVVVSTGQIHTSQIYAEFLEELRTSRDERGTQVIRGVAGADIPFDPAIRVEVLAPNLEAIKGADLNNASIVLRLTYGQVSVLLTGDAEVEEERWMIDRGLDLRAQVLKVSHHGSKTASSEAFLDAVDAEIGMISCSANNRYGHPHAEVLERLVRSGVKTYRTDRQGTVRIVIDGNGYRVETQK